MVATQALTPYQVERYSRHIIMPQVSSKGQRKLFRILLWLAIFIEYRFVRRLRLRRQVLTSQSQRAPTCRS